MATKMSIVIQIVVLPSVVFVSGVTEYSFKLVAGYKTYQGTELKIAYSKSVSTIFCATLCSTGCGSAIYNPRNKTCITFVEKFYNSSIVWIQDPDWLVLYRDEPSMTPTWGRTMVFRAQKAINLSLYDVWTTTGRHDDIPLSSGFLNGCYRLDNLGGCKQHFRSSILDNWNNIKQSNCDMWLQSNYGMWPQSNCDMWPQSNCDMWPQSNCDMWPQSNCDMWPEPKCYMWPQSQRDI
ncbi:hypothetical protein Btru_022216 [Bulinus truncatus]|nr:hypothetical protein Btru_022216 [Bulinus truncatus]